MVVVRLLPVASIFELLLVGAGKKSLRIRAARGSMLVIWFPVYALPVRGLVRVKPGTPEKSPLAHAAGTVWVCDQGILG